MSQKEDLEAEITREELCLAELRIKIAATTTRLAELRGQLAAEALVQVVTPWKLAPPIAGTPAMNTAKVTLFRSLFRGREDIFPRRWENVKKDRSGYAPACDNEWQPGLCEKKRSIGAGRRATCGECSNKAFIPVSDEQIARHLRGDHVMGVYPLLTDETCWFLAADFDDETWQEDAAALPVSWKGTLIQYTGRLHRLHSGKTEVRIYDYVDNAIPMMMKMSEKRLRGYRAIGYAREEAPLGLRELENEAVIEFDDEALRSFDEDP
jgi:hypothetical protein